MTVSGVIHHLALSRHTCCLAVFLLGHRKGDGLWVGTRSGGPRTGPPVYPQEPGLAPGSWLAPVSNVQESESVNPLNTCARAHAAALGHWPDRNPDALGPSKVTGADVTS